MRGPIAGLLAAVLVGTGCGGEDDGDTYSRADQNEDIRMVQMRIIEDQVREGELPPITPKIFNLLYDATLRAHDEAERRVISGDDAPET